jgi:methylthioribose-1-phosphate isomerase
MVVTIDQTKLPNKTVHLKMVNSIEVADAIKKMKIRGAPLIGVAAAFGLALTAFHSKARRKGDLLKEIKKSAKILEETRPTAVNLFWAVKRILHKAQAIQGDVRVVANAVVEEAVKMADEDVETNRKIGVHGAKVVRDGSVILTHCNAGSLATVDYGTALGVIRVAKEQGKTIRVIATETRPKLQGARLTAYELKRDGIPITLITDSMVGYVMSKRLVNLVVVGADRVVRDAVINKIGTYTIAVLAYEHGIPFYVAAPKSTFDLTRSKKDVVIEERESAEVTRFGSQSVAPDGIEAFNPAFDITPLKYVEAVICETGIIPSTELTNIRN